jgi:Zn-dependent protease with chaperone function
MKEAGANAFALPSGVIVITDELVQLAKDDREIVGVLAHECGHIVHRHSLRAVLQNSAVFVLIALITGDVSSATAFGGALPTFLLQNRFSREFEREADAHAVTQLKQAGIPPSYLADMLQRLATTHGESDSPLLGYLRTHPPTPERIQAIRGKR